MKLRVPYFIALFLAAMALSVPAYAFVVNIDNFEVLKNGSTLMNDDFSDTAGTGFAGTMSEPPASGGLATYGGQLVGQSEGSVAGKRTINTSLAPLSVSAATGDPIQLTQANLITSIGSNTSYGLRSGDTFKITGLFDLYIPIAGTIQNYGIRLFDSTSTIVGDDELRLNVGRNQAGQLRIGFQDRDRVANTLVTLESLALDINHDQILLMLEKTSATSNLITASFAYVDNGIVGATMVFTAQGDIFNGENWTRAGFRVSERFAVPEPSTLAILGLGLAGLGFARRRRKQAA